MDESARLSAVARRKIMKLKDEDSHAPSAKMDAGEFWYMDKTRDFDEGPSKNKYGLVFVESKTWLLRVRYFGHPAAGKEPTGKGSGLEFRALASAGQRHETELAERDLQRGNTNGGRWAYSRA